MKKGDHTNEKNGHNAHIFHRQRRIEHATKEDMTKYESSATVLAERKELLIREE